MIPDGFAMGTIPQKYYIVHQKNEGGNENY
jgi:hypothetical protein